MVQDMGFEYTFTENSIKPGYCDEEPWLPECADGPQYVGDSFEQGGAYCEANPENCEGGGPKPGNNFFGAAPKDDSFCSDNPEATECTGGNIKILSNASTEIPNGSTHVTFNKKFTYIYGDNWIIE